TSNGSATAGSDYTTTAGTVMFANGDAAPKTFNVPILDDTLVEGNETFNVNLTAPTGGATLGAPATEVVTITDFEPGQLQFSSATGSVNENGGTITITVTRTGGTDGAVSASYTTSNGTATAGSDYTTTAGTVNFAAGDGVSKTFNVPITNDALVEGNETFNVTLSAPTGGATLGAPATEVVTIVDGGTPGTVQFSTAVNTVSESAGTIALTVTRTGGSSGPLTVTYTTSNGTATAPSDYAATTNTVTFLNGDAAPKTINIPIVSDAIPEPPESFTVSLSMPTAGTLGAQSITTVTITPPLEEIPVLGPIGKLLLALSTMASALWIMGRRRFFGFLFAAAMIGVMTSSLSAATTKPVQPVVRAKAGGHNPHNLTKNKVSGVLADVQTTDKNTTLKFTNGTTIAVANSQAVVSLNGGTASISALAAGQKVTIVTMTDPKGNVMRVKIKIKH
ncbi:MAG TPA: Calx-beta domain-containing protein, partial [Thermoanaerobaculia bacterium]|nr:Calx-beta domain-containing protein [Thermoanaerobaculia bacterium]